MKTVQVRRERLTTFATALLNGTSVRPMQDAGQTKWLSPIAVFVVLEWWPGPLSLVGPRVSTSPASLDA